MLQVQKAFDTAGKIRMFQIRESFDAEGLNDLFLQNDLELSDSSHADTVRCWEIMDGNSRIAGLRLERRKGELVLAGIAVNKVYRNHSLGKILLEHAVSEARKQGAERLILVARAPRFFEKAGFLYAEMAEFSGIINCGKCAQFYKGCFPSAMCLYL